MPTGVFQIFLWIYRSFYSLFQIHILEFILFAQSFDHCRTPEGMAHCSYPAQIHGVLAAESPEDQI